jgi:hypothetical protein
MIAFNLLFPCGHATKCGHGLADVAKVNVGQLIVNQSKTLNCLSKERNGQRSYKKASVFSRGRARLARADNGQQTQNADSHNSLAYPPNLNLFVTPPKAFSRFLETTPTTPPKKNKNNTLYQFVLTVNVIKSPSA